MTFVDFLHDADGLVEGDDDLLVLGNVFSYEPLARKRIFAAFGLTVFQPLFADLIAADVKIPHLLRYAAKTAGFGLVQPHGLVGVGDFLDQKPA